MLNNSLVRQDARGAERTRKRCFYLLSPKPLASADPVEGSVWFFGALLQVNSEAFPRMLFNLIEGFEERADN